MQHTKYPVDVTLAPIPRPHRFLAPPMKTFLITQLDRIARSAFKPFQDQITLRNIALLFATWEKQISDSMSAATFGNRTKRIVVSHFVSTRLCVWVGGVRRDIKMECLKFLHVFMFGVIGSTTLRMPYAVPGWALLRLRITRLPRLQFKMRNCKGNRYVL
jgi:hypothetical protein